LAPYPIIASEASTSYYKGQIISCAGVTKNCWKYNTETNKWADFPPTKFLHNRMPGLV
jgi:hypothetical protein